MIRDATTVTVVGRAGTNPQVSLGSTGDRVNFRVVSTDRRFDKVNGTWVDGDECWLTVVCWQGLAKAVMTTVRKGDPIVVIGRITNRRFEKNGVTQYFTDVRADLVGLDTARLGSRFTRTVTDGAPAEAAAASDTETSVGPAGEFGDTAASAAPAASPWPSGHDQEPAAWDQAAEPADDSDGVLAPSG